MAFNISSLFNKSPLEIAGVDVPNPATGQAVNPHYSPDRFHGGLDLLESATKRVGQSLAFEAQSLAGREAITEQTAKLQSNAVAQHSAALVEWAKAATNKKSVDLGGLAKIAFDIIEKKKQQEAELLKRLQDQQMVLAFKDVQDLKTEWTKKIYEEGVGAYRQELSRVLAKYPHLKGDDVVRLLNEGYSLATQYQDRTQQKQLEEIEKIHAQRREVRKYELGIQLSAHLAGIKENPYASTEENMRAIDKAISDILNDKDIPELDKLTTITFALQKTMQSLDARNESYTQIMQRLEALQQYSSIETQLNEGLRDGSVTPAQAQTLKQYYRLKLGVHPSYNDVDPLAGEKFIEESMRTQRNIRNLAEQNQLDAAKETVMSEQQVAVWAWNLIKNPELIAEIEQNPKLVAVQGMKRAISIAQLYRKGEKDRAELELRRQAKVRELAAAQKGDIKYFIALARQEDNPTVKRIIEELRIGIPQTPVQQLTPEQKRELETALSAYRASIINELAILERQAQEVNAEFAKYGLYGSKSEIEARMKKYADEIEAFSKQFEQSQLGALYRGSPLQLPGGGAVQPPFKVNSLGLGFAPTPTPNAQVRTPFPIDTQVKVPSWLLAPQQPTTQPQVQSTPKPQIQPQSNNKLAPPGYVNVPGVGVVKVKPMGIGAGVGAGIGGDRFNPAIGGLASAFSSLGKQVRAQVSIRKRPFHSMSDVSVTGKYAEPRGTHTHAGVDWAAPMGTKILSTVSGKVVRVDNHGTGYGYFIDILGDDGMLHRYAHIMPNSALVKVGSRVKSGQWIARVGSSGTSSGPHLHYEVRNPNKPFGFDGTVDPVAYLDKQGAGIGYARVPASDTRTSLLNWKLPVGAIPIAGGYFFHNGKLKKAEVGIARAISDLSSAFTNSRPLRAAYVPNTVHPRILQQAKNSTANYGYAFLAQDSRRARVLNRVAANLGIHPMWLADIIAFETAGRWSPAIDNGAGYVGLIQCGPECQRDLGLTYSQIASMSFEQQMQRVVEPYLKKQLKYAGMSRYPSIEYVMAAIWGGPKLMKEMLKRGPAAVINDSRWNDYGVVPGGGTTFRSYLDRLGSHAGRKYNHSGLRIDRVTSPVHKRPKQGCSMCQALLNQGGFTPHEPL